jgi:hypothetical protein
MTMNTAIPQPIFLLSFLSASTRHPATHQYQTKYPDASLEMICTWYDVNASSATVVCMAADVRTKSEKRESTAGAVE